MFNAEQKYPGVKKCEVNQKQQCKQVSANQKH